MTPQTEIIATMAEPLTDAEVIALIRKLNERLTFSYGADRIERGCDMVAEDLVDEQRIPDLEQYERRCVSLNPHVWSN